MKVYKSIDDETADTVSAVMIYKGMRTSEDKNIQVEMIDSKLHVFTRLRGRKLVSTKDSITQKKTFADMESIITQ